MHQVLSEVGESMYATRVPLLVAVHHGALIAGGSYRGHGTSDQHFHDALPD